VPALSHHALGDTVQRGELEVVKLAVLVLLAFLQIPQALLEAVELALEDIRLIDFICNADQLLFRSQLEHGVDVFCWERGSCGVARIDDHHCLDVDAFLASFVQCVFDTRDVGTPSVFLLEVVRHALRIQQAERGSVERILWDRDQDASVRARANDSHERINTRTCTSREVNVLWIRRVPIPPLNELSHTLPDPRRALRLRVRSHALHIPKQCPRTLKHILLVPTLL